MAGTLRIVGTDEKPDLRQSRHLEAAAGAHSLPSHVLPTDDCSVQSLPAGRLEIPKVEGEWRLGGSVG